MRLGLQRSTKNFLATCSKRSEGEEKIATWISKHVRFTVVNVVIFFPRIFSPRDIVHIFSYSLHSDSASAMKTVQNFAVVDNGHTNINKWENSLGGDTVRNLFDLLYDDIFNQ